MQIYKLTDAPEFIAGDGTILREVLRPVPEQVNIRYSLAHARLPRRSASVPHRLKTTEVYYVLEGRGIMHIDAEQREVVPGDCIYIPPLATQFIESTGDVDLVFLCIVDPAWLPEDEEIL